MLVDNIETIAQTVLFKIFPESEHVRLVHADIDSARGKALRKRTENIVDESIGPFLADKQNVIQVANAHILLPAENAFKVRKRLHAGHELDSDRLRICIELLEFLLGISAAHISEIGLVRHLKSVLGIELYHVVSHF